MGREVQQIHKFVRGKDDPLRLTKGVMVVRCDDGYVYEFEKNEDSKRARLVRGVSPDGELSHLKSGRLPSAVEETAEDILGVFDR